MIKQELLLPVTRGRVRARGTIRNRAGGCVQVDRPKSFSNGTVMAQLHHHCELIGWSEPKVITRFLIVAIVFALFSLTTLKLR